MMKISAGIERLIFFFFFVVAFFHISACMFVMLAQLEYNQNSYYIVDGVEGMSATEQYVISLYFIITTISTVGFGDISGSTTAERIFCIILMLIGVFSFTFVSGALASILSNFDASQAALNEKLMFLQKLRA